MQVGQYFVINPEHCGGTATDGDALCGDFFPTNQVVSVGDLKSEL